MLRNPNLIKERNIKKLLLHVHNIAWFNIESPKSNLRKEITFGSFISPGGIIKSYSYFKKTTCSIQIIRNLFFGITINKVVWHRIEIELNATQYLY